MTLVEPLLQAPRALSLRPTVRGKFLFTGDDKLFVRGVTYGTFRPGADRVELPPLATVKRDLRAMAEHGINAVRTYTVPPLWMLDAAGELGLRVLAGFPAERQFGVPANRKAQAQLEELLTAAVRSCQGHPALLAFAVGNEFPASQVRWHGRRRVERHLEHLVEVVRQADPGALVTYVNYPSTEYLELPSLDLACFNVYLENPARLRAYLGRLQNVAGDRPLLMT